MYQLIHWNEKVGNVISFGIDRQMSAAWVVKYMHHQVSNISHTKSQHLKDSRIVLGLSLPNPLKPDVKSRMKM